MRQSCKNSTTQWSFTPVSFGPRVCLCEIWMLHLSVWLINLNLCVQHRAQCAVAFLFTVWSLYLDEFTAFLVGNELTLTLPWFRRNSFNMYLNTQCCPSCLTELVIWEMIRLDKEHKRKAVSRGLKQLCVQRADSLHHNIRGFKKFMQSVPVCSVQCCVLPFDNPFHIL